MRERHILAAGGGWYESERRALDELVFGLTGKERPRVCYLPTAGGDSEAGTLSFYASLGGRAETSHLVLFQWEAGVVLAGSSAGMICWFQCGVTDSFGPLAALHDGLGFLAGSACPHYDGEPERRPTYTRLIADGFPSGLAADDGAVLYFNGTELQEVVSFLPGARAYRVGPEGETPLEARQLR